MFEPVEMGSKTYTDEATFRTALAAAGMPEHIIGGLIQRLNDGAQGIPATAENIRAMFA